jgi:hypothetical protein
MPPASESASPGHLGRRDLINAGLALFLTTRWEGEPIFAQENTQKKQDDYYGELSYADIT